MNETHRMLLDLAPVLFMLFYSFGFVMGRLSR